MVSSIATAETEHAEAMAVWDQLEKLFSNFRGMSFGWIIRFNSERINAKRFRRLARKGQSYGLPALLSGLSFRQLVMLQERSAINLKMASDALRLYIVVNVSAPAGTLLISNQLAPSFFPRLLGLIEPIMVLGMVIGFILTLILTTWYAYAGVHQARDLSYLLASEVASARLIERAHAVGPLLEDDADPDDPDADTMPDLLDTGPTVT